MLGGYIMDMVRVLTEWYRLTGEKQRKAKDIRKRKEIENKKDCSVLPRCILRTARGQSVGVYEDGRVENGGTVQHLQ